jgi:glycosyltransferase involved in cell wall biosynthesis
MRVLISTSTFPLQIGDALPRFVYDLADALTETCHVTVLAPAAVGFPLQEVLGRVEVRRFKYFWPESLQKLAYGHGMRDNMRASPLARVQPLTYCAAQTLAIRSLVRQHGFDVVNSHWMIPQGLSAALARGRKPAFRHVLSVHSTDVHLLHSIPVGSVLARFVLSRSNHVFVVSNHMRSRLDSLSGQQSNATVLPMGVRNDVFRGKDVEPMPSVFPQGYLLFFGRFAEVKGITYLLRALPEVLRSHAGIGLVLIGYGTMEQRLRDETQSLGLGNSVVFAGKKTHEEIVRYLRGCRAVVVPSILQDRGETEGLPTVIMEALAAGSRVVASNVDGIPDIIRHGENGWLCEPAQPKDLAEKILVALADREPSSIRRHAVETAKRFDWRVVAANYAAAFQESRGRNQNMGGAE